MPSAETVRIGIDREGDRVTVALRWPGGGLVLGAKSAHLASLATVLGSACDQDQSASYELFIRAEMTAVGA